VQIRFSDYDLHENANNHLLQKDIHF